MKLVTYYTADQPRVGAIVDVTVVDVTRALEASGALEVPEAPTTRELLRIHGSRLEAVAEAVARAGASAAVGPLESVRLGPPVHDPSKILCIGLNYKDHVAETGRSLPEHPDVFAKFATTLIGPNDAVGGTGVTDNLDFEGELAIVIGSEARNVAEDEALSYVAGAMVLNDVTARDLQYRGTQWLMGKAVDGTTPCGPALVTLDEIGDLQELEITTHVNDVEVQHSNTRHMIFPIAQLVSYVSRTMVLQPGDVIATGTPEGIGAKRNPPLWLQPDDQVVVTVERVGALRSVVGH